MKWMHIADLHIGKTHEAAELENDQRQVLAEILEMVAAEKPDGMLIAGDVYDRSMPSERAVKLFDDFLARLSDMCAVYMISGNHDSGERLSFGSYMLSKCRVHISGSYNGTLEPIPHGDTDIYLMPYLSPVEVRRVLDDGSISGMQESVRRVLETAVPGTGKHRIILAHLFVTNGGKAPEACESESQTIKTDTAGGLDGVDYTLFDGFDYVALGHIHGPQCVGREAVRYAGTPQMFSFSEEKHVKSVTVIETGDEVAIRTLPIKSGRRMRRIRGLLSQLLEPGFDPLSHDDIILAEITDTVEQPDAQIKLLNIYNTVLVKPVGLTRRAAAEAEQIESAVNDPIALISEFFRKRSGRDMTNAELEEITELWEEAEREGTAK